MVEAYIAYSQAAAIDPANQTYWLRSQVVRSRAELESKIGTSTAAAIEAAEPAGDAEPPIEKATFQDRLETRKPLPPSELSGEPLVKDFDLRGDSKKLFEEVARAFGLESVFDSEYQPVAEFRFQQIGVDYRQALRALEVSTASFIVPL